MGTITVGGILDRAEVTLLDEENVRWSRPELLAHYNAGIRLIVGFKPDLYVLTTAMQFVAGSKQTLPAGGTVFRALLRNMGSDGLTPGSAIMPVTRNDLDQALPGWHSATGTEVDHSIFDPENPKVFYIYPAVGTKYGEVEYAATPTAATDDADILPIDDIYDAVLQDYVVGLALQKSSKSGNIARADWYANRVAQALGLRSQGQFQFATVPAKQAQA